MTHTIKQMITIIVIDSISITIRAVKQVLILMMAVSNLKMAVIINLAFKNLLWLET